MRPRTEEPGDTLPLPHGDPQAVRAAAALLRQVSARALATAGVRGDATGDLAVVWTGDTAERAEAELSLLSLRARQVLPALAEAGLALDAYAEVLEATVSRTRALRARDRDMRAEHARLVAAAEAGAIEPSARAALVARADARLVESLSGIRQAHSRARDDFDAAGVRCARRLAMLDDGTHRTVGGGGPSGVEALLNGLSLVEQQIQQAAPPAAADGSPADETWRSSAVAAARGAAAWTFNHTVVPLVNGAADLGQAMIEHPEDLLEAASGAGLMFLGGAGEAGGASLDISGVGVVVGVPLHVAAAGVVTAGGATATDGLRRLLEHAADNDHELLREIDGPTPGRGGPGEPIPDSQRPDGAGATWKGRVSRNGKGEVWQDPEKFENPLYHEDADSMRYMDPTDLYPDGYVRFHGEKGHTLTLEGGLGTRAQTHHPMTPEYTYDIPKGWNP